MLRAIRFFLYKRDGNCGLMSHILCEYQGRKCFRPPEKRPPPLACYTQSAEIMTAQRRTATTALIRIGPLTAVPCALGAKLRPIRYPVQQLCTFELLSLQEVDGLYYTVSD